MRRAWRWMAERVLAREPAVTALVLVHVAAALALDLVLGLDVDEAFTLDTTGRGPLHAIRQAVGWELQPPLYFALLSLWRLPFEGWVHARLFSTLCTAAAIFVLAETFRRFTGRERAGWVAAALAFNPLVLWSATQARGYALVLLLCAGMLLTFYDGFVCSQRTSRARWAHAVLVAAGLYTQYYTGFLAAGCGAALLVERRFRATRDYLVCMVAAAVLFLPMALQVPSQFAQHAGDISGGTSAVEAVRRVEWLATSLLFPSSSADAVDLRPLLVWPLGLAGLWLVWKVRRRLVGWPGRALLSVLALQLALFVPAMAVTGEDLTNERHVVSLLPTLALVYFGAFAAAPVRWALPLALALTLPFTVQYHLVRTARLAKPGDSRRVAVWLEAHEQPGEPVAVFHSAAERPLWRHYRGPNVLVPLPFGQVYTHYDIRDYVLPDAATVRQALEAAAPGHRSLWVYMDTQCEYVGVDFGCPLLEQMLAEDYVVEHTEPFYRATLRRFRRR